MKVANIDGRGNGDDDKTGMLGNPSCYLPPKSDKYPFMNEEDMIQDLPYQRALVRKIFHFK